METEAAENAAQAAAKATKVAVDWATVAPMRMRQSADSENLQTVLADCSDAANFATAAAAAAVRSAEAAAAGNGRAARGQRRRGGSGCRRRRRRRRPGRRESLAGTEPPTVIAETENATAAARISLLWQVIPYILITMAEICISVVGLELAFAAAPAAMKSFVTACWLLTVSFGDILNAQITPLYNETFWGVSLTPDWYFLIFALLMVPVTLAFALVARRFNRPAT